MTTPGVGTVPTNDPEYDRFGPLGQCVYEMSTGRRCQKSAETVLKYGSPFTKEMPAYGYCHAHAFSVTRPRDARIHRTAQPLTRGEDQS
jgi:hypothetical protein